MNGGTGSAFKRAIISGMEIAAGEYGYDLPYFRRMLEAEAVDVLQADATRCGGITFAEALNLHLEAGELTSEERAWTEELRREKYAADEWTYRL